MGENEIDRSLDTADRQRKMSEKEIKGRKRGGKVLLIPPFHGPHPAGST